jgi:predicted RNA binding protein YcfA (HicA-like mRNA interferase family)
MRTTIHLHEIYAVLRANGWTFAQSGAHEKWVRGSQTFIFSHHGKRSRMHPGQLRQQLRRLDAERDAALN